MTSIRYTLASRLEAAGIKVTVIMDAAAAYFMEDVDIVLVGAEAVVENGGVINKVFYAKAKSTHRLLDWIL